MSYSWPIFGRIGTEKTPSSPQLVVRVGGAREFAEETQDARQRHIEVDSAGQER